MLITQDSNERLRHLAKAYYIAKGALIREGYAVEMDWQYEVSLQKLDEQVFLREAAWVILSSGMRETVIRGLFADISQAFFNWESSKQIAMHADHCKTDAIRHFNHQGKIGAIIKVATHVYQQGFSYVAESVRQGGVEYLQQLPYLGPATSCHLAKNIGLPVAKPDRHLLRLVDKLGFSSAQHLCLAIADITDDPIPVIDLVLWRYSTRYSHKINQFAANLMTKVH
jgi:hypothetical protein